MKAIIYSDRNIESGRAQQLLKSVRFDELVTYYLDDDFNNTQFQSELVVMHLIPRSLLVQNMLVD